MNPVAQVQFLNRWPCFMSAICLLCIKFRIASTHSSPAVSQDYKSYSFRLQSGISQITMLNAFQAEWIIHDSRPPDDWPGEGNIIVEEFDLKYREGLPLVLKQINCDIKAGEKVLPSTNYVCKCYNNSDVL